MECNRTLWVSVIVFVGEIGIMELESGEGGLRFRTDNPPQRKIGRPGTRNSSNKVYNSNRQRVSGGSGVSHGSTKQSKFSFRSADKASGEGAKSLTQVVWMPTNRITHSSTPLSGQ